MTIEKKRLKLFTGFDNVVFDRGYIIIEALNVSTE